MGDIYYLYSVQYKTQKFVRSPIIAVFWEIEVADFNEDVRSFTGS